MCKTLWITTLFFHIFHETGVRKSPVIHRPRAIIRLQEKALSVIIDASEHEDHPSMTLRRNAK